MERSPPFSLGHTSTFMLDIPFLLLGFSGFFFGKTSSDMLTCYGKILAEKHDCLLSLVITRSSTTLEGIDQRPAPNPSPNQHLFSGEERVGSKFFGR